MMETALADFLPYRAIIVYLGLDTCFCAQGIGGRRFTMSLCGPKYGVLSTAP